MAQPLKMTAEAFKLELFSLLGKDQLENVLDILSKVLPEHDAVALSSDVRDWQIELKALARAASKAPHLSLQFAKIRQRIKGDLFTLIDQFKAQRRGREVTVPKALFPHYKPPRLSAWSKEEVDMSLPFATPQPSATDLPLYKKSGDVDMSLPWETKSTQPKKEDMSLPWEKPGTKVQPKKEDMSLPFKVKPKKVEPVPEAPAAQTPLPQEAQSIQEATQSSENLLDGLESALGNMETALGEEDEIADMTLPWETTVEVDPTPSADAPATKRSLFGKNKSAGDSEADSTSSEGSMKESLKPVADSLKKAVSGVKGFLQKITPGGAFKPEGSYLLSIIDGDSQEDYQVELLPEGILKGEKALRSNIGFKTKTPVFNIPIKLKMPGKLPIPLKGTWEHNPEANSLEVHFKMGLGLVKIHCKFDLLQIQGGRIYGKEVGIESTVVYLARIGWMR